MLLFKTLGPTRWRGVVLSSGVFLNFSFVKLFRFIGLVVENVMFVICAGRSVSPVGMWSRTEMHLLPSDIDLFVFVTGVYLSLILIERCSSHVRWSMSSRFEKYVTLTDSDGARSIVLRGGEFVASNKSALFEAVGSLSAGPSIVSRFSETSVSVLIVQASVFALKTAMLNLFSDLGLKKDVIFLKSVGGFFRDRGGGNILAGLKTRARGETPRTRVVPCMLNEC